MGERDPFGREQGEDSLAGMGWRMPAEPTPVTADAAPAAAVETVETPEPEPAPVDPRAWVPTARRRRGPSGWRMASWLIRIAILAAVVVAVASVAVRVGDSIDGALNAVPETAPATEIPRGLDANSYLVPENFRVALARMRGEGRVQSVRVAPATINARLVSTQRRVVWNMRVGEPAQRIVAPPYYDFDTTIAFSQIDPDAPARFARAAARRARRSVDDVDFLFLQRNVGRPRWVLYFEDRDHYTADRHGRHVEHG
jgi:hypothetical protein